ncbi:tudor domain-containing protein 10 isoform X2 [Hyla sarda]|uniref:tudor domain-containing protein 10 isoform X2 n=1 Tax=Hyla sarda TaxID=327740 RepID=UPI0024C3F917|nr:tudor domain-containing protein 10 isoform X2 [Hyla sarda]
MQGFICRPRPGLLSIVVPLVTPLVLRILMCEKFPSGQDLTPSLTGVIGFLLLFNPFQGEDMERSWSPGKGGRDPEVYVGNLPYDVTEDEILMLFKDFNPIHAQKLKKDLRCFAFVQMSSEENAFRAIDKLHLTVLRGRQLKVSAPVKSLGFAQVTPNGSGDPHDTDRIGTDRLFISNLPCDVTEDDLRELFQDFKLERIKIIYRENYSFAFVTLCSVQDARMVIYQMHGVMYRDRRISCKAFSPKNKDSSISEDSEEVSVSSIKSDPRHREAPDSPSGQEENEMYMDYLQKDGAKVTPQNPTPQHRDLWSSGDKFILRRLGGCGTASVHQEPHEDLRPDSVAVDAGDDAVRAGEPRNGSVYIGSHLNQSSVTTDPRLSERVADPLPELTPVSAPDLQDSQTVLEEVTAARNRLLIPVEMRGPFLAEMLRGCFGDLSWLEDLTDTRGELSLLVTSTYPDTDYFWATRLTQETYLTLSNICMSLAQAQPQLPCLMKGDVQRGARCMGCCALTDGEQGTWSRCWVADVAAGLAVVFFVDYGVTNVVPISTLRPLDDDQYWSVPPMALPFLLLEGSDVDELVGTVFRGRVCGTCTRQRHILKFCPYPKDD